MDGAAGLTTYLDREFAPVLHGQSGLDQLPRRLADWALRRVRRPPRALVAHALRQTNVGDAGSAYAVLDALSSLDFARLETASARTPAEALAWFMAHVLSRTNEGFDALERLRTVAAAADLDLTPTQPQANRVMLQAAGTLDPHPGLDPAPAAVAAREAPLPTQPLREALLAWHEYLPALTLRNRQPCDHTRAKRRVFRLITEFPRRRFSGTDLARARERLQKSSGETIDRTAKTAGRRCHRGLLVIRNRRCRRSTWARRACRASACRPNAPRSRKQCWRRCSRNLRPRPELSVASALRHAQPVCAAMQRADANSPEDFIG